MRNVLLDVWVLAGVCLQVIQLAGTDLQKAQITRHEAGATEAEWAARRLYSAVAATPGALAMAGMPLGLHRRQQQHTRNRGYCGVLLSFYSLSFLYSLFRYE